MKERVVKVKTERCNLSLGGGKKVSLKSDISIYDR
jgi:hypothetical protein